MSAACSSRASDSSAEAADSHSSMRSLTSSPADLRPSWTSRTTSRASPRRISSGVRCRSRARVSPASVATAQPSRGVSVITTSSRPMLSDAPSTTTVAEPVPRRAAVSATGSAAAIAAATGWVPLPKRRPSERKFAFTLTWTSSSVVASSVPPPRLTTETTLSSSASWSRSSAGIRSQPGADTRARPRGWRVRTLPSARAPRPSSTSRRIRATCSASSGSASAAESSGQSCRCTESPAPVAKRSCHTRSVTNGVNGAMSRVTVRRHSCSVCRAAGSPSQNRRRERRTYQLDRSSM